MMIQFRSGGTVLAVIAVPNAKMPVDSADTVNPKSAVLEVGQRARLDAALIVGSERPDACGLDRVEARDHRPRIPQKSDSEITGLSVSYFVGLRLV